MIKGFFANYFLHNSDVTFDMTTIRMEVHQQNAEPWRVTLVDMGEATLTGGRLKRVAGYLDDGYFPKFRQCGQLNPFQHHGVWQPMDTLRDNELLERLWQAGTAPWKTW